MPGPSPARLRPLLAVAVACGLALTVVPAVADAGPTRPDAPVLQGPTLRKPTSATTVKVRGTTTAQVRTVNLYTTADCSGAPIATVTRAQFAGGVNVGIAADATTTIYATGLTATAVSSDCSAGVAFVNDSTPPPAPVFTRSAPASPARAKHPRMHGTAEAGTRVFLYAGTSCSGAPVGLGLAVTFGDVGLQVGEVPVGLSYYTATSVDAAGNVSACSVTPIAYTALA